MTKKEIKSLYESKKLNSLLYSILYDGTKADLINALYLLFKKGGEEYNVSFESLPYSRGGRYVRHTSTLYSTQKWEIKESAEGNYYISTSSTSKSANCPVVIVPKFYTEKGKQFFNSKIENEINKLKRQLL